MSKTINVRQMFDSLTWLNWKANKTIRKAFSVALELGNYVHENTSGDCYPEVEVSARFGVLILNVGPIAVWHSELHESRELTFKQCLNRYLADMKELVSFDIGEE